MAQGTPEIPGFQPLEIRGGGELGIWIEARQVRLDRKVLLKVLPAGESHLESEFLSEVQKMVQLDGRGVLRVIEEGQVGKARFVALDEAGGIRPKPEDLGKETVPQLVTTLLALYLETHELGVRPGRIPVESLRLLPAGGFAVCELGKLTTVADSDDPDSVRAGLSETLRRWCRHLKLESEVESYLEELRQTQDPLPELLKKWQQQSSANPGRSLSARILSGSGRAKAGFALLTLAIPLLWFLFAGGLLREGPSSGTRSGTEKISREQKSSTASPGAGVGDQTSEPQPPVEEERSQHGANGEGGSRKTQPQGSVTVSQAQWDQILLDEKHRLAWMQLCQQVDPGKLPGNRALLQILSLSEEDRSIVEDALLWQESLLLKRSRLELEEYCRRGEVAAAEAALQRLSQRLPAGYLFELEELLQQAKAQRSLMERLWSGFQISALETLLVNGRFDPVTDGDIGEWLPGTRFDAMRDDLIQELMRVSNRHQEVLQSLGRAAEDDSPLEIPLSQGLTLKGRLLEISPGQLVVKPVGRKEPRVLAWSEIDPQWSRMWTKGKTEESTSGTDSGLTLLWGGLDGLDSGANFQGLPPRLLGAATETLERRVESAWQNLEALSGKGDAPGLRDAVEATVRRFGIGKWTDSRKQILNGWWITPQMEAGPSTMDLFPGAAKVEWTRQQGSEDFDLEVLWNSPDGIVTDWVSVSASGQREARGNGVLIRGEINLESPLNFEDRIRIQIEGAITVREKPNLNLVLWTGSEVPLWFGLGYRPPERSSFTSAGETVLLPAHGIMKVPDMVLPDSETGEEPLPFPLPVMGPRLAPGQLLQLEVLDTPDGSEMSLNGRKVLDYPGTEIPRKGGIAFQTFGSPVMIRALRVTGSVSASQWRALLMENAQKTLWKRP